MRFICGPYILCIRKRPRICAHMLYTNDQMTMECSCCYCVRTQYFFCSNFVLSTCFVDFIFNDCTLKKNKLNEEKAKEKQQQKSLIFT